MLAHEVYNRNNWKNSSCHILSLKVPFYLPNKIHFQVYIFMRKHQNMALHNLKENLPEGHAIVQMDDLVKNLFTCTSAEEVQSEYYNSSTVTLHPLVTYYRALDGTMTHDNYCPCGWFSPEYLNGVCNSRPANVENTSYNEVMGTQGLGSMNENCERFSDLCPLNQLVIGGSIFPHKRFHKATWRS